MRLILVCLLWVLIIGWAAPAPLASEEGSANGLQCRQMPYLFEAFLRNHYVYKTMTQELKTRTVSQFIKALDPSKTLFLASDVAKLKQELPSVFHTMKAGDCHQLDEAEQLVATRAQQNEAFIKGFMGPKYKLDDTVELVMDPEKRTYPKDVQERDDLLRKYAHFQISNYLLSDMKLPEAKKQLVHRYELITKRARDEKEQNMPEVFSEAFAQSLDPHSDYLSKDTLEDFQISMRLSLEGIGASLSYEDGFTVIEDTIPGGGADRSKLLKPKDKIIAVAQGNEKPVNVIDMDLRDVVKLIRGKKGTKVRLTILRQGPKTQTFDVSIIRDKIDIKDQAASISYETKKVGDRSFKIGIINLPSFYGGDGGRSSYHDMKDLIAQARKQKVDGLVLDLSHNGGGLLEDAVKIAGLFIKTGGVVGTKDAEGNVEILSDTDDDVQYNGPLLVLTSHLSASASEILAGALHDYHRALIVGGDRTFGKGTVQNLANLPLDLGGMKVTIGMFFLPGGESTQHQGVASDILVPSSMDEDDIGENKLEYSLPPQHIQGFLSKTANTDDPSKHWVPVEWSLVGKLASKSTERVDKSPKFAEIRKDLLDEKRNKGVIRLADLRKKIKAENQEEKKWLKLWKHNRAREKELENPLIQEGENIMADWLAMQEMPRS